MEPFSLNIVDLFQDRIAFINEDIKQLEDKMKTLGKWSNERQILVGKVYDLKQERKLLLDKIEGAKYSRKE